MATPIRRFLLFRGCFKRRFPVYSDINSNVILSKPQTCRNLSTSFHIIRNLSSKGQNVSEYCVDLVRQVLVSSATTGQYDYENFLSSLLLPRDVRAVAFAIRAFNVEIAQVRDMVHDKKIGEMRMQFWKDTLDKIYFILCTKKLSKHWFQRMIDCRTERLSDQPFSNLSEVEAYSENSVSSSYYLILESINIKNIHADHVASHVGKAQGLTNLIRSIPYNIRHGRITLPNDIMIKHKLSQEDVVRGRNQQALKDVVYEIACLAHKHIETSNSLKRELPKEVTIVFLSLKATHWYLTALEKVGFSVFHPTLQRHNAWLPISLWWSKMKRS